MFGEIGALSVDHVAVTTADFEETSQAYLSLPGARLLRGPGWNPDQHVKFAFIQLQGDLCVEVLGLSDDGTGPIAAHVGQGGGAYHLCYAVARIADAIAKAEAIGCRVVVQPRRDTAFDGRRVAFLLHPATGLFELVEAYGDFDSPPHMAQTAPPAAPAPDPAPAAAKSAASDLDADIQAAFTRIFPGVSAAEIPALEALTTKAWDSLGHMRLMMEIERRFDIRIPSQAFPDLVTYDAIRNHLRQATS